LRSPYEGLVDYLDELDKRGVPKHRRSRADAATAAKQLRAHLDAGASHLVWMRSRAGTGWPSLPQSDPNSLSLTRQAHGLNSLCRLLVRRHDSSAGHRVVRRRTVLADCPACNR
jgi:hypothetical protein